MDSQHREDCHAGGGVGAGLTKLGKFVVGGSRFLVTRAGAGVGGEEGLGLTKDGTGVSFVGTGVGVSTVLSAAAWGGGVSKVGGKVARPNSPFGAAVSKVGAGVTDRRRRSCSWRRSTQDAVVWQAATTTPLDAATAVGPQSQSARPLPLLLGRTRVALLLLSNTVDPTTMVSPSSATAPADGSSRQEGLFPPPSSSSSS
mmetsp:Transcript_21811/g.70227  ORF Transcript_21811/g.70227 Transcript_21811/m.70227 type:complete len:200 (-) Transcript_21811:773-1372(-)